MKSVIFAVFATLFIVSAASATEHDQDKTPPKGSEVDTRPSDKAAAKGRIRVQQPSDNKAAISGVRG